VVAAGAVQAATILKKDNLTFKIGGDWQIQLRQDIGVEQDLDVEYDDLEIKTSLSYDLGNGLAAFGGLDFGFKNAADKSNDDEPPHLEEAYVGFKMNDVRFLVGKTDSAGDEFGIAGTIETVVADDAFDAFGATGGDDLLKVTAQIAEMVTVVAAYEIEAESESSDANGTFADIFVGMDIDALALGIAYQTIEEAGSDEDTGIWGLQAAFDAGFAEFAVDYSVADDIGSVSNFFVALPVNIVTLGAGFVMVDPDDDDADDVTGWYANAVYKFPAAKNVSVFAEIGDSDVEDVDMGYLVGARIKF
jgi:predicted porin